MIAYGYRQQSTANVNNFTYQSLMNQPTSLFSKFITSQTLRRSLKLPPSILQPLEFFQYTIRSSHNSPQLSNSSSLTTTTQLFNSFSTLSKQQQIQLYLSHVSILSALFKNILPSLPTINIQTVEIYFRTTSSKPWKRTFLKIILEKLVFEVQKKEVKKIFCLGDYIVRKFQCPDYFSFTMEGVNGRVKEKYRRLYCGFVKTGQCDRMIEEMRRAIEYAVGMKYAKELGMKVPISIQGILVNQESKYLNNSPPDSPTRTFQPSSPSKSIKKTPIKNDLPFIIKQADLVQSQIISRIIDQSVLLKDIDQQQPLSSPPSPLIFQQLLPHYNLQTIQSQSQTTTLLCKSNYRIVQNNKNRKQFKMFFSVSLIHTELFPILTGIQQIPKWNHEIESINVKNLIKSQNSAVMYMKLRNYSKTYRGRDFLYLRHVFNSGDVVYIVDKSIENLSYPPFMTIVRGEYTAVYALIKGKEKSQTLVVIDVTMDHSGIVSEEQNTNLTIRYLEEFGNIKGYIQTKEHLRYSNHLFSLQGGTKRREVIDNMARKVSFEDQEVVNDRNKNILKSQKVIGDRRIDVEKTSERKKITKSMKQIEQNIIDVPPIFQKVGNQYKLEQSSKLLRSSLRRKNIQQESLKSIPIIDSSRHIKQQSKHHILEQQSPQDLSLIAKAKTNYQTPPLDSAGMSITNWNCLHHKYKLKPWYRPIIIDEDYNQHHIWKGEWKHDDELGGLFYKDQEKMNAQKKVLGYIVKKMGSNILQGKGITSISLPVDIFSTESNLERVARTFAYAPKVLEPISKLESAVEQMKSVIIVSLTHSLLYLSMQKPFNPVLGETFQGSINGCPIYLEQISHHPPIASFYLIGRGYKIYGSIESKMNIGMNSGTGTNDGDYIVEFDNGNIIKFRTPGGEISGLTFGDRKLNLVGKGYYWSPNKNLMLQVTYNPNKKGFFSVGKAETPSDYFSGTICGVTPQYIKKFEAAKNKPNISKKDIIEQYSKVEGVWTGDVIVDGNVIFNAGKQKYLKFQYQPNPLPSDANYREDVIYRRLGDIVRSQTQKERIEDKQRKDRKLRQKIHGKKH